MSSNYYHPSKKDENRYLNGSCHILALAFVELNPSWNFEVVFDRSQHYYGDDGSISEYILHVYAKDEKGYGWDILGCRPIEAILSECQQLFNSGMFSQKTLSILELKDYICSDEKDAPLKNFWKKDLFEANKIALKILKECSPKNHHDLNFKEISNVRRLY